MYITYWIECVFTGKRIWNRIGRKLLLLQRRISRPFRFVVNTLSADVRHSTDPVQKWDTNFINKIMKCCEIMSHSVVDEAIS